MKIETKLEVDQNAWFMWDNKPISQGVSKIEITINPNPTGNGKPDIKYEMPHPDNKGTGIIRYNEGDVFATKQELLNSL